MDDIQAEEIKIWVGLDWADEEHAYALQGLDSETIETGTVLQEVEELQGWINQLRASSEGGWVAVALEHNRGPLLSVLMDYEFVLIYPINPKSLANYRKAFYPSGGKSDPTDAALILDYLLRHREKIRLWSPDSTEVRALRMLASERRKLVNLRTELTNRWRANLKNYYPQVLDWVRTLHDPTSCDFLQRWSSLQDLQQAKPAQIRRFFRSHGVRGRSRLEEKLLEMSQARALTQDSALVTTGSLLTRSLAKQIRQLNESIRLFDERIAELFENHEDFDIFTSFPGSGAALGPRLLSLFGEDRERYESAEQVAIRSGIAPLIESSGKTRIVRWRWACPKFLRQGIHEFAAQSRHWCPWAGAFYQMQRDRGKQHHKAVRALAFKWIRIIFRCWKDRTPYNDEIYMASLKANNAPLLAYL
jgi:transposase